jgi:beta-galactosidase
MSTIPRVSFLLMLVCVWRGAIAQDISGHGWRLWPDREAAWHDDSLYLPAEVHLADIQSHPPTGGWKTLGPDRGIPVTLPSTVEEHFWGAFGTRPYTKNEAQRGAGTSFPNGNYLGVSWWWKTITVPHFRPGQRVVLHFRGARLRAEVYCNQKLCGYSIMEELPFDADITDAVSVGGSAQVAVRITNPGGHLDWIDFSQMQIRWGRYTLPPSHGFGGLDSDIELTVRDPVSVTDLAAINTPDTHRVLLVAEVSEGYRGPVHFNISRAGQKIWNRDTVVQMTPAEHTVTMSAFVPSAQAWDVDHPVLYKAKADLGSNAGAHQVTFGFRFFTAEGLGADARLTLNGRRIVPLSAISWGYWGRNGLWPDAAMAEREVADAKKLGLNMLQCHRNIGKPAVFDLQDLEGLLRNEEPGGGKFALGARYGQGPFDADGNFLAKDEGLLKAFDPPKGYVAPDTVDLTGNGPDGDAKAFWEKYEEEKILEMVKRDRSHPSVVMYTIQNESNETDIRNPRIYRLLREIHALDPSRITVLYSGGVPRKDQVLMLPYSEDIRYAGANHPFAGWEDIHTCGGPCNYLDFLYQDPTHFFQRRDPADKGNIAEWGEALGAATPDNYAHLIHSFDKAHPGGYELADMRQILGGYHRFLDKWGFRKAFPSDSSLFDAIGYRTYYFWKRIIEQTRMDDTNDYLVVSGWESTTIDNHSGLVDNHRFFKGNPAVIAAACRPEVLVIQPRHVITARGDQDTVDLFLINQTGRQGPYRLSVTVRRPDGSVMYKTRRDVQAIGGETYGQLLSEGVIFTTDTKGMLTIDAVMEPTSGTAAALRNTDTVEVIGLDPIPANRRIAVWEPGTQVKQTLQDIFHVAPVSWEDRSAEVLVLATGTGLANEGSAASDVPPDMLDSVLARVYRDGIRLVLWPDDEHRAGALAKALADRGVIRYQGMVGNLNAPWFGSWFFVRKHALLSGLATDCAMDWRYGVSAFGGAEWLKEVPRGTSTNGLLLDGKGIESFVGFGADHNCHVGVSGCLIPYGRGSIVLYCLPQMVRSLEPGNHAINRIVCRRLLRNAVCL